MSGKKSGSRLSHKHQVWVCGYVFAAPTVVGVIILNLWSVAQTIYFSFNEVKGFSKPVFAGLENYVRLFQDKEVFRTLGNTFLYALMTVPVGVFLSLLAAVLLNTRIKGKGIFRCIYFLPVVSAPAAVALVWRWLYNKQYGLINQLLDMFGITGPDWLGTPGLTLVSVAIVGIWSMIGYNMIILIAGLQEIPTVLYEAADIDGAGPIPKFFKITLPMASPTVFFVTVTTVISSLQVFDHIFMMMGSQGTANPAFKSTASIVYLFYRYTFENYNKGYGSTIVVLLLVIILMLTWVQMKLQKRWVHYQ